MSHEQVASFAFAPLTPAAFLHRSARVFPDRVAVVDGSRQWTYREFAGRCDALRHALAALGIGKQDRVAALCANSHVMLELQHAVPAHGAVLVPVNTRLAGAEMSFIVEHSGARVLLATTEFAEAARQWPTRTPQSQAISRARLPPMIFAWSDSLRPFSAST